MKGAKGRVSAFPDRKEIDRTVTPDRILDTLASASDVKALNESELRQLAAEIREDLVRTVASTGGHLAPNLGVVELTLGLHRALDMPTDRIVWDVGHQSYVHKMLTGRRDLMPSMRQYGGLCGFPKRSESEYDVFDTGHASNSISVALGMALARDIAHGSERIVAVIGDGSMTGGMAYEALNHAGHVGTPLVVILNDNEMSISPNVGALAKYLARVRLDPRYNRLRDEVESRLARIPRIGEAMVAAGEAAKESFKQLLVPGMLFEEFGFKYVGPIDGHDVAAVEDAVRWSLGMGGPVLVHVVTRKGAGYVHAEDNPDAFHGVGPFHVESGASSAARTDVPSYTSVFGRTVTQMAARDERICAITAAMPAGTGLSLFATEHPERFFDVGIAEAHAVGLAAGLATRGMIPIVAIYSTFLQRAYDQLIMDVALQGLHVVFCLDRAGFVGEDGPTHHGVFDLTYLRSVPNFMVMAPADEAELVHMLHTAVAAEGPVAIRYPRGEGVGVPLPTEPVMLEPGVAQVRKTGTDVALFAVGRMVTVAEHAAELLDAAGVSASVVNARWIKPVDERAIERAAASHRLLVSVEESTIVGGFGSAVAEVLADCQLACPLLRLGVPDCFVTHGATELLLAEVDLTPEGVCERIMARLSHVTSDAPLVRTASPHS